MAEFAPVGDGDFWWTRTQYYSAVSRSWGRADYKMIGPADKSDGYKNWLGDGSDATVAGRKAFSIVTDDKGSQLVMQVMVPRQLVCTA